MRRRTEALRPDSYRRSRLACVASRRRYDFGEIGDGASLVVLGTGLSRNEVRADKVEPSAPLLFHCLPEA